MAPVLRHLTLLTATGRGFVVFAAAVFVCRLLVPLRFEGGDTATYLNPVYGSTLTGRDLVFHTREPGCVWCFQLAYAVVGRGAPEWLEGVIRAFTWMSVVSGGVFTVFASAYAQVLASDPFRRAAVVFLLLSGAYVFLFFGHLEMYAPFVAALMGWFLSAACFARGRCGIGVVWAAFTVAATMHRVALVYLPAMWWLLPSEPGPWRRRPTHAWLVGGLLSAITLAMTAVACQLVYLYRGEGLVRLLPSVIVMETYNWLPELLTPLTQAQMDYVRANSQLGSFHLFTMGSLEHVRHVAFFTLAGAPVGLLVVCMRLRHIGGALGRFLTACSLCGWAWIVVWHPHRSYLDWDLFTQTGLAVNALAAATLFRGSAVTAAQAPSCPLPDASLPRDQRES